MPEFATIDKRSQLRKRLVKRGVLALHVRDTYAATYTDALIYPCVSIHASRDVILTTLVNDDIVCSDIWSYSKLRGLSVRSIELVHRKRYLLHRVTRWNLKAMTSISVATVCWIFEMTGFATMMVFK